MISLTTVIDTLHIISLPTELTINEGNAEIQVIEKGLTLRSKKQLKRGRWAPKPVSMTQEEPIKYESRPDPAIYCPLLYGPCDSQSDDESLLDLNRSTQMILAALGKISLMVCWR